MSVTPPSVGSKEIAEFFIAISLLLIFSKSDDFVKKNILLLIFLFSIVVSHYTSAYLYLIIFGSYIISLFLIEKDTVNTWFKRFKIKLKYQGKDNFNIITVTYVLIFLTFTMGWYMYVSQSSSLESVVKIGNSILTSLQSDFFSSYGNPRKFHFPILNYKKRSWRISFAVDNLSFFKMQ